MIAFTVTSWPARSPATCSATSAHTLVDATTETAPSAEPDAEQPAAASSTATAAAAPGHRFGLLKLKTMFISGDTSTRRAGISGCGRRSVGAEELGPDGLAAVGLRFDPPCRGERVDEVQAAAAVARRAGGHGVRRPRALVDDLDPDHHGAHQDAQFALARGMGHRVGHHLAHHQQRVVEDLRGLPPVEDGAGERPGLPRAGDGGRQLHGALSGALAPDLFEQFHEVIELAVLEGVALDLV